jgi:hypothetical protein
MNVEALAEFLNASAQRPFVLGKFDCVSFTFEGVRVGWDRDYLKFLEYSDRRSAVDRLRGSDGLYDAICEGLGQDVPMCDLTAGDIAWIPESTIGLIMPDYIAVKAYRTIFRVPFEFARSGWKTA